MGADEAFPVGMFADIAACPEDFRLLRRVPLTKDLELDWMPYRFEEAPADDVQSAVVLDTETTGLDPRSDDVIELSLVRCSFSRSRVVLLSVDACYDGFADPGRPLDPKIVEITGITDADVHGQSFDEERIAELLQGDPLLIAHNAAFDRPMFDKTFRQYEGLR